MRRTSRARIDLVGPQSLSLRELLVTLRAAMHLGPPRFLPIPMPLVRVGARVAGVSAMSPLDSETLSMLEAGTRGDPAATGQLLGRIAAPGCVSERRISEPRVTALATKLALGRSRGSVAETLAHRRDELPARVRLVEPAERMRALGELARCRIGVRAGEDAADAETLVDHDRRFDAVGDARETDVHQHEVGMLALGDVERFRRGRRKPDAFDADGAQLQLAVDCDEVLIFDDEDAR